MICKPKQAEIEALHEKTLYLLEKVGVDFQDDNALALFKKHGFRCSGSRVYFSGAELAAALSGAPERFTLCGLNSSVEIGGGRTVYSGASGPVAILRGDTYDKPLRSDYIQAVMLDETSPVIDVVNAGAFYVADIPAAKTVAQKMALSLKHTNKPVIGFCGTEEEARLSIEIAGRFYGNTAPYYLLGVGNMVSPLTYTRESIGALHTFAAAGQPIVLSCCSIPGLTSPISLVGTLLQNNAEVLAGLVYSQLLNPGTPVVYGNATFAVDMRYGTPAVGGVETGMLIPYIKALSGYYHLPCRAGGAFSDAKQVDYQCGAETMLSAFYTIMYDVDFSFHSLGELDGLNLYSFEKYLLDEEIVASVQRAQAKPVFAAADFCLEDIEEVGPGGHYLLQPHTNELMRQEFYVPKLSNRGNYAAWREEENPSQAEKAQKALEKRLLEYQAPALSAQQQAYLAQLLQ